MRISTVLHTQAMNTGKTRDAVLSAAEMVIPIGLSGHQENRYLRNVNSAIRLAPMQKKMIRLANENDERRDQFAKAVANGAVVFAHPITADLMRKHIPGIRDSEFLEEGKLIAMDLLTGVYGSFKEWQR